MIKNLERRVENLEIASGQTDDTKQQAKKLEEQRVLFKMSEYYREKMEMSMTPEEILQANEETTDRIIEWYVEYMKLSPEEKETRDREQETKETAEFERDKAFLASEEYKQFEVEYAEFKKKSRVISQIDKEKQ